MKTHHTAARPGTVRNPAGATAHTTTDGVAGSADTSDASGRWSGSVTLQPGLMAFTGAIGPARAHEHACLQVVLVTSGQVLLSDEAGDLRPVHAAIIPAGIRHEMHAGSDATGLMVYLDPDSPAGRAAAARITQSGADPRHVHTWVAAGTPRQPPRTGQPQAAQEPLHPGLTRAIRIGAHPAGEPPGLGALAARTGISASRLGHLFADQLGLPYPAWRRWTMLRHAINAVRSGSTLTEAAHAAGFADSAHLSRTCRAMFGITPTEALRAAGWRP